MVWANWHPLVPQRFKIGTQGSSRENREEFQPRKGPPISRRATEFAEKTFDLETVPLTLEQFGYFEDWWENTLKDGNLPFNGIHPITKAAHVARIPSYTAEEVQLYIVVKMQYILTFG